MSAIPLPLTEALAWLAAHLPVLGAERVPLAAASGRTLAETVPPAPGALLAAIDGHAVLAAATQGASDYAPLPLAAAPIVAGAPLPAGTDGVLPLLAFEAGCALAPIAPGDGLAEPDPAAIEAGTRLSPLHLAVLALRGQAAPLVRRRPRVALRIAGPKSGPDALAPLLAALLDRFGTDAEGTPDLILLAGRSGPGPDDTARASFTHLAAHGLPIHPGDSAAIGAIDGTPALLLPGDPVACFLAFHLLAAPALRRWTGRADPVPVHAHLTRKIVSSLGQLDAVPVRLAEGAATPLPPLLSAVAAADGLALIADGSEGYPAGAGIAIFPFE